MKIYTKTGDNGTTGLMGCRLPKDDPIIEAMAFVDLLNTQIGMLYEEKVNGVEPLHNELIKALQDDLMLIMGVMSGDKKCSQMASIRLRDRTMILESSIDMMTKELPELTNFIYPRGLWHVVRAYSRVAESKVVKVVKSLSSDSKVLYTSTIIPYLNKRIVTGKPLG